jgi:hypothetical protein
LLAFGLPQRYDLSLPGLDLRGRFDGGQSMRRDEKRVTSGDDAARSQAVAEVPHWKGARVLPDLRDDGKHVVASITLEPDPWLFELFFMQCRAKKVVDANPDLYPDNGLSPERQYTSRKLNMTPLERKQLADGVRAARRKIRAAYEHVRR